MSTRQYTTDIIDELRRVEQILKELENENSSLCIRTSRSPREIDSCIVLPDKLKANILSYYEQERVKIKEKLRENLNIKDLPYDFGECY